MKPQSFCLCIFLLSPIAERKPPSLTAGTQGSAGAVGAAFLGVSELSFPLKPCVVSLHSIPVKNSCVPSTKDQCLLFSGVLKHLSFPFPAWQGSWSTTEVRWMDAGLLSGVGKGSQQHSFHLGGGRGCGCLLLRTARLMRTLM